jgi:hypothetical protein
MGIKESGPYKERQDGGIDKNIIKVVDFWRKWKCEVFEDGDLRHHQKCEIRHEIFYKERLWSEFQMQIDATLVYTISGLIEFNIKNSP